MIVYCPVCGGADVTMKILNARVERVPMDQLDSVRVMPLIYHPPHYRARCNVCGYEYDSYHSSASYIVPNATDIIVEGII